MVGIAEHMRQTADEYYAHTQRIIKSNLVYELMTLITDWDGKGKLPQDYQRMADEVYATNSINSLKTLIGESK